MRKPVQKLGQPLMAWITPLWLGLTTASAVVTTYLSTKTGSGKGLTLTDYNDGKIHGWNGGECPVHPNTVVCLFFRRMATSGRYFTASGVGWLHHDESDDIVAFQVVKEYKEPLVVWVNIYKNGFGPAYKSEKEALSAVVYAVERTAVKFIEVQ
jgi:hypothetical protein